MKEPSVSVIKKYLTAMGKIKAKYITSERLSKVVGVYPEVINENLSYFDPLLMMDYEYNLLELVPAMKQFVIEKEEKKDRPIRVGSASKKEVSQYSSVTDFFYKRMTFGGMIDKDVHLSDEDLKVIKKLASDELIRRKHGK